MMISKSAAKMIGLLRALRRTSADGTEIQGYCKSIAQRYGFADKALFHTHINSLRWDEEIKRWRVGTNRGDDIRARFVILACGVLSMPKLPGIPGIDEFKGKIFHTARWDYEYTGGGYRNPICNGPSPGFKCLRK
jgi:cation diffusion facilitator CzcD-associated flavoprotein CzcO